MSHHLKRILELSSPSIAQEFDPSDLCMTRLLGTERGRELVSLLAQRNGFFAFESALLVRPINFHGSPLGIVQWNDDALWRHEFDCDFSSVLFFAEDIFGAQFCFRENKISSFDPETGDFQTIAQTLEQWAAWILEDYRVRTGWPLAHEWQVAYGQIEAGQRLLPKRPFVLGGQFSMENLFKLNDVEGMSFRASIAVQLRDCPDGSTVMLYPNEPTGRP